jgi:hypothetical protein
MWTPDLVRIRFIEAAATETFLSAGCPPAVPIILA